MKKYDLVVFGSTGFTGTLISHYLFNHTDTANIKWAIAGRDKDRLQNLSNKFNVDYIIADSFNQVSLNSMCEQSKLIITTVGPYSIYGESLIESCIINNTHYLDLTGELNFVKKINFKYNEMAKKSQSIIIHSCGFESIPSDLGTYLTVKELDANNLNLTYYLKTKGKISGGTWASFLNSISNSSSAIKSTSKTKKKIRKIFFSKRFKKWALIFPVIDKYIVMKSSKDLKAYGNNFNFNLYALQKSIWSIIFLILGLFFLSIFSRIEFLKNYLLSYIPSGTGPKREDRLKHWFEIHIIGKSNSKEVRTIIKGGDPGYDETSKMIAEMALCILTQSDKLLKKNGILTPVECTGDLMMKRLQNAGISFSIDTRE